ncbi:MAG: AMIN domain-containing protein [Acidobacteria bacterium]|nr:AMIN domain-containing protein [Acidobacteriota bacterium]
MKRLIYLGLLLILGAMLSAQTNELGPAAVRKVEIVPVNGEIRVEVTLSAVVTPSVAVAQHPDRLVLKLPGTLSETQQKRIAVGQLGVRVVRFGLNQTTPPETHLVVDLDSEHSYKILTDGKKIILVVEAPPSMSARKRTGPAAAASRPLISTLGRGSKSGGEYGNQSNEDGVLLTPPPSGPPIQFPRGTPDSSANSTTASTGPPTAQHPKTGSLQQGTVFPTAGSPGTGEVPPVSGLPRPSGLDTSAAGTQASVSEQPAPASDQALREALAAARKTQPETTASVLQGTITPPAPPPVLPAPVQEAAVAPPPPVQAVEQTPAKNSDSKIAKAQEPSARTTSEPVTKEQPQATAQHAAKDSQPATDTTSADSSEEAQGSGQGQLQMPARAGENSDLRTAFRVKYVAQDAAYLDGGRAAGLTEGMKLVVRDLPHSGAVASEGSDPEAAGDVAELVVLSVAETSSVTEIHTPKRSVKIGDLAYLSSADQQSLVEKNALSATRKYPAVISFTENDTLDDEARAEVPKPPLPSVNRARGRIGFDYIGVLNHDGSGMQSSNLGVVLRADITRLNGTYWNVSGYWRGRLNHTTAGTQTLQDLLNRTYHLYTTYDNPNSAWVAGFGRMYLPWATSLDTIDGGYFGRRLKQGVTAGVFLGSTPDPTSYSYAPNREIGGSFVNFEGGSYEDLHYTSTTGAGMKLLSWSPNRPFLFAENSIFYKRIFSIYQSSQLDSQPGYDYKNADGTTGHQPGTGFGLGRSFLTMRAQVHPKVELSFNHTYFRDLPSFDPSLIQTGLLDKYLMQGFSAGTRVEIYKQVWLSADLGLSNRTGDKKNSLNEMFGITFGRIPWVNMHADARYSRFNSSFGSGSYEALSLSKNLGETLQLQILAGQQNFASTLSAANRSRFVNIMMESALGEHYFVQGGGTINRGNQMNYDQWIFTFGYRFDNRHGHR